MLIIQNFDLNTAASLVQYVKVEKKLLQQLCTAVTPCTPAPHQETPLSPCGLLLINGRCLVIIRQGARLGALFGGWGVGEGRGQVWGLQMDVVD